MTISSSAFSNNGKIPFVYTCDGEDINPPFKFHDVPEESQSLVLIVEDPDSTGKTWVHWVVFNINPSIEGISEDAVPSGAVETVTDFGSKGYGGPCPSSGIHRYNFRLYALDTVLDLPEDVTRQEIDDAMLGHILETAEITGLYSRE